MAKDDSRSPLLTRLGWWPIPLLYLALLTLYGVHLATGWTPPREALYFAGLDLAIYWYGFIIVGGIALGAWVVSRLASARGMAIFEQTVPPAVRQRPLTTLSLPADIADHLSRRHQTLGPVLLTWGFEPRDLSLKGESLAALYEALTAAPDIEQTWLDDPPWRGWNPEHVWSGLIWCLVLAVIGARLYHVLTPSPSMAAVGINSPADYFRNPYQLINIRSGGLGIYGGIAGGALGLALYGWRRRIPALAWADLAVVGLALGQAIGRWGNFFNQELYGRPTDLPWAVAIDPRHRLPAYSEFSTFHPAFLYESLWNVLVFALLLTVARRHARRLRTGELTAAYLILYAVGRTLLEMIRLDSRTLTLAGIDLQMAVATAVSLVVAAAALAWVLLRRYLGQNNAAASGR